MKYQVTKPNVDNFRTECGIEEVGGWNVADFYRDGPTSDEARALANKVARLLNAEADIKTALRYAQEYIETVQEKFGVGDVTLAQIKKANEAFE